MVPLPACDLSAVTLTIGLAPGKWLQRDGHGSRHRVGAISGTCELHDFEELADRLMGSDDVRSVAAKVNTIAEPAVVCIQVA